MKRVYGNLLDMFDDGKFDIIIQGCNCYHSMSGGIALQIAERYPKAEEADKATVHGLFNKLGKIDLVRMNWKPLRRYWFMKPKIIINAYTQHKPGRDARLDAVRLAFEELRDAHRRYNWGDIRIGMPEIGCGIGGLDWIDVENVIMRSCGHLNITKVEYQP